MSIFGQRRTRKLGPEAGVQLACRQLCEIERIPCVRMQTGKIIASHTSKKTGKTKTRSIKFGEPGMADLLLLLPWNEPCSMVLWCETKPPKDGVQAEAQKEFEQKVTQEWKQSYLLVNDVDVLRNWLRERGFLRRR